MLGKTEIFSREARQFTDEKAGFVQVVAGQAAIAIEIARLMALSPAAQREQAPEAAYARPGGGRHPGRRPGKAAQGRLRSKDRVEKYTSAIVRRMCIGLNSTVQTLSCGVNLSNAPPSRKRGFFVWRPSSRNPQY